MRLPQTTHRQRTGFTLVEILIVIVIILILAGLISAVAARALGSGRQVRNRHDIAQLATSLENFKGKYGFYPPSKVILCESLPNYFMGTNPKSPLHALSLEYLSRMWPRLNWNSLNPPPAGWVGIDWDGSGTPSPDVLLEGDQCLVFFLGGIPDNITGGTPAVTGFSTNPSNPAHHVKSGGDVTPPLFEFVSSRLVRIVPPPLSTRTTQFFSYADTYSFTGPPGVLQAGAPYAYFSSYKVRNGYVALDCQTLGVTPYAEGVGRFLNPSTYQIISAGSNNFFGTGSFNPATGLPLATWTSSNPYTLYPAGGANPGSDDQSNFHDTLLGNESK